MSSVELPPGADVPVTDPVPEAEVSFVVSSDPSIDPPQLPAFIKRIQPGGFDVLLTPGEPHPFEDTVCVWLGPA